MNSATIEQEIQEITSIIEQAKLKYGDKINKAPEFLELVRLTNRRKVLASDYVQEIRNILIPLRLKLSIESNAGDILNFTEIMHEIYTFLVKLDIPLAYVDEQEKSHIYDLRRKYVHDIEMSELRLKSNVTFRQHAAYRTNDIEEIQALNEEFNLLERVKTELPILYMPILSFITRKS